MLTDCLSTSTTPTPPHNKTTNTHLLFIKHFFFPSCETIVIDSKELAVKLTPYVDKMVCLPWTKFTVNWTGINLITGFKCK